MAKIISSSVESQPVGAYYPFLRMLIVGLISGIVFWLISMGLNRYVILPITCPSLSSGAICENSLLISGRIAIILIAVASMIVMVKMQIARPLIVAVSTSVILWNLIKWTSGLSTQESILWSSLLFIISFLLFSWLTRYEKIIPVLIFSIVIVLFATAVALI